MSPCRPRKSKSLKCNNDCHFCHQVIGPQNELENTCQWFEQMQKRLEFNFNRLTVLNSRVIERQFSGNKHFGQWSDHSWASSLSWPLKVLLDQNFKQLSKNAKMIVECTLFCIATKVWKFREGSLNPESDI